MATSMCRVCLVSNTRMLNIDNIYHLEMYEKLTDTKFHTEGDNKMPSTVCYVCHRQLQRCHRFSHVAHKSNKILQDLLLNGTEITQNIVTMQSQEMYNLSVAVINDVSINIDSATGNTAVTIIKEQGDVEEEETNGTDEIKIEEIKLEMPDENFEIGNISNNTEPSLDNDKYKHLNVLPLFCCDVCNIKKTSKYQLSRHLKLHTRGKPHSCNRCDMAFTLKSTLTRHKRVHTGEKSYICNRCDKAFIKKCHLTSHMIVHTREKPYSCSRCDKAFTQKCSLTSHMMVHTGEKPYSCSRCDKAFVLKKSLVRHMHVHTGQKPYFCSRCDKAFIHKFNLTSHMMIHTGEKPYSCSRCDKAFSRKYNLTTHMRVHSGEKSYSCSRCDRAFGQKTSLVRHMRVHTVVKPCS